MAMLGIVYPSGLPQWAVQLALLVLGVPRRTSQAMSTRPP